MKRALVIAAVFCAPFAIPAEAQDQEIVQLAPGPTDSPLSSDLTTIVETGAEYRGVTRAGRTVVRPRQGLGILLESFKLRGLSMRAPTAPVRAVNELIVSLQTPGAQLTDLPEGASVVDRVTSGSFAVVRAPNGITPELVRALASRPQVTRIEPSYPHFLQRATQVTPNDPNYPNQRGLESIRVERAWSVTTTTSVMVAVLDTGIDLSHPDLARNLWHNPKDTGQDEDKNGCPGDLHGCDFTAASPKGLVGDSEGHGTHVAGIIGAVGHNGDGIAGVDRKSVV